MFKKYNNSTKYIDDSESYYDESDISNNKSNSSNESYSEKESNNSESYDGTDLSSNKDATRYIKNLSNIKLELLNNQEHRCANKPNSKLYNLGEYQCLLWEMPYRNGRFDKAGYKVDHIIEYCLTKNNDISNLQLLCPLCHSMKTSNFMKSKERPTRKKSDKTNKIVLLKQKLLKENDLGTINNNSLRNIVNNTNKLDKCLNSIVLYINKESQNEISNYFVGKSSRQSKILIIIKWLEDELEISRFDFVDLEINKPKYLVKKMIKRIDKFRWLSHKTARGAQKKEIISRINKLTSEDRVKKFCMDVMNNFDDFYSYKIGRKGKKRVTTYFDFKFNNDTVNNHIRIINYLNVDSQFFSNIIRNKI